MAVELKTIIERLTTPSPEQIERERAFATQCEQASAEAEQRRRRRNFAEFIGDRKRYATATLDSWIFPADSKSADRQRVVVDGVREFIAAVDDHRRTGTGAVFFGPVGTGKDLLSAAIVRAACLQYGHSATFVSGIAWFVSLRDAMDGDGSESELIRKLTRPDWLVLSDPLPPAGDLSSYQSAMLSRATDERYSRGLPTIVTINVRDGEEAIRRIGAATWDRLKHDAWVFPCNWPSFRAPARVV